MPLRVSSAVLRSMYTNLETSSAQQPLGGTLMTAVTTVLQYQKVAGVKQCAIAAKVPMCQKTNMPNGGAVEVKQDICMKVYGTEPFVLQFGRRFGTARQVLSFCTALMTGAVHYWP